MAAEMNSVETERGGFWEQVRRLFSTGSEYKTYLGENFQYRRKLLDYRIENFLDKHLHDYMRDFGILDESALERRSERVFILEDRSERLLSFVKDVDTELAELETRMDALERDLKKK